MNLAWLEYRERGVAAVRYHRVSLLPIVRSSLTMGREAGSPGIPAPEGLLVRPSKVI